MAANLVKLAEDLSDISGRLEDLLQSFGAIERMTNMDSYIMGHIRCIQASITSASDFIHQCNAYKSAGKGAKQSESKASPPVPAPK